MFGRLFQKRKKKADDSRIAEEAPRVVEENPKPAEKSYRIVVVKEDQAKLRKNAVKFLNDHGFNKQDVTAQEKREHQDRLRNYGVKNARLLNEELIVARAPDSYEIYGVAHLGSLGTAIDSILTLQGESHDFKRRRIDAILERLLLSKLAVDPQHGGQGIGHALVEKAIEVARDGGYKVLCGQVDTEVGDNDKLTKFYRDCGFTVDAPSRHPLEMVGFKNPLVQSPYKGNEFFLKL